MSKIQAVFTGKGRQLRDDEKPAMEAFIAKYHDVLTQGKTMNQEFLKFALDKLNNMSDDELETSLKEFGLEVVRIEPGTEDEPAGNEIQIMSVNEALQIALTELRSLPADELRAELDKHKDGELATSIRECQDFLDQLQK